MSLRLGKITTIVVSSPSAAKQVLKEHDHIFSNRTLLEAVQALDHHNNSVIWLPANSKWRRLRKLCAMEIFSTQRVDLGQALRGRKVQELLHYVGQFCDPGRPVEIGRVAFTASLNLLSNTIFSMDLAHYDSENSQEFKDLIWNIMEVAGKPNVADFFPGLRWVDPQGLKRKMTIYARKLMDILEGVVMERLRLGDQKNDILDALLEPTKAEGSDLSVNDIVHILVVKESIAFHLIFIA
ncbi:Cytochrome P450, partial [Dillenia turbinata]